MAFLRRIALSGFKSIKELDLELRPLNVLIGANGAGKSNLLLFLRLLKRMSQVGLRDFVAKSGGADSLLHFGAKRTPYCEAAVELDNPSSGDGRSEATVHLDNPPPAAPRETIRYAVRLAAGPAGTMIVDKESVGGMADESPAWHELARGLNETALGEGPDTAVAMARKVQMFCWGICLYHLNDTSPEARIRQPGYIDDNRELRSDGCNLAAVLYRLRKQSPESPHWEQSPESPHFDYYGRVVKTIRQFAPWFEDFAIEPLELNEKSVQLDWRECGAERLFGPHELPDGALRAMAMTTLLLQPPKYLPSFIVIDEPELGLHPAAVSIIAALCAAALRSQVIVATQSPTFLDEFDPEDVIAVDRENGASTFTRQDPERLHDWLEEYSLGELWQKNVMGGGPF